MKSTFQLVSEMNTAFGNPKGDPLNINWPKVQKQFLNVPDEVGELFIALGGHAKDSAAAEFVKASVAQFKKDLVASLEMDSDNGPDLETVRDSSRDIVVFTDGGNHLMGIDADEDMRTVLKGVMTRFIKDDADKAATIAKHAANGVTEVYFEGSYPTMVMKSAVDQPDAPKGKFLKSASYKEFPFYDVSSAEAKFLPRRQTISLMDTSVVYVGSSPLVHLADVRKMLVDSNLRCVEWSSESSEKDPRFSTDRYEPKENTSEERFAAFAAAEGIVDLKVGDFVAHPETEAGSGSVVVSVTYKTPTAI